MEASPTPLAAHSKMRRITAASASLTWIRRPMTTGRPSASLVPDPSDDRSQSYIVKTDGVETPVNLGGEAIAYAKWER